MAKAIDVEVDPRSLNAFTEACARVGPDADRELRTTFGRVGSAVRSTAAGRMVPKSARSAAGYREHVESDGVAVFQSLPRTTGQHPEFAPWQVKHILEPALASNAARINHEFETATDRVCDRFERT